MLIIYLFIISFLFFLFFSYKKAVITLCVFAVSLAFVKAKLGPLGSVYNVLGTVAIIIGLFKYGLPRFSKNPLSWCFILPFLSYLTTMLIYNRVLPSYLLRNVVTYLMPVLLYFTLQKPNDFRYYVKCMKWYLIIIVIYCFFEEITQSNPIMGWCTRHPDLFSWMTMRIETNIIRFGFRRTQSLFGSEASFACVCMFYFYIIRKYQYNRQLTNGNFIFSFLTFAIPCCILFTGARSAMVSFLIMCIGLVSFNRFKRFWYYYAAAGLIIIILFPYFNSIYDSIINSSNSSIGGSNEEMRQGQWEIALYYLSQNPEWGNGIGFTAELMEADEKGLFGAEGMWLTIMIDRGIFGVISTLASYLIIFIFLIKKKMYSELWIFISFLFFKTVTSVVGVSENYVVLVAVFLMRYKELQKKSTSHYSLT